MLRTNQMELSLPYGYEYQGPTTRLAITPLTDRALLNLMTAMKLHYTGGVFGPAQTGKTETMHEVSKVCKVILNRYFYIHPNFTGYDY